MTSPDDRQDQIERRRLHFLEEWRAGPYALDEEVRERNRGAIVFAQSALRNASLLNGGALIAIPTFVALFGVPIDVFGRHIVWAIGLFIVGLGLACLATFAAYFTMVLQGASAHNQREAVAADLHDRYQAWIDAPRSPLETDPDRYNKIKKRTRIASECWRWAAIILCFGSFAAFVAGAWLGGAVMTDAVAHSAAGKPAQVSSADLTVVDARSIGSI